MKVVRIKQDCKTEVNFGQRCTTYEKGSPASAYALDEFEGKSELKILSGGLAAFIRLPALWSVMVPAGILDAQDLFAHETPMS